MQQVHSSVSAQAFLSTCSFLIHELLFPVIDLFKILLDEIFFFSKLRSEWYVMLEDVSCSLNCSRNIDIKYYCWLLSCGIRQAK